MKKLKNGSGIFLWHIDLQNKRNPNKNAVYAVINLYGTYICPSPYYCFSWSIRDNHAKLKLNNVGHVQSSGSNTIMPFQYALWRKTYPPSVSLSLSAHIWPYFLTQCIHCFSGTIQKGEKNNKPKEWLSTTTQGDMHSLLHSAECVSSTKSPWAPLKESVGSWRRISSKLHGFNPRFATLHTFVWRTRRV